MHEVLCARCGAHAIAAIGSQASKDGRARHCLNVAMIVELKSPRSPSTRRP